MPLVGAAGEALLFAIVFVEDGLADQSGFCLDLLQELLVKRLLHGVSAKDGNLKICREALVEEAKEPNLLVYAAIVDRLQRPAALWRRGIS
ncbi:hypothetical protein B0H66DRAFT_558904 [Apodospora peruviana]|uniref:Uncharacterized protein n=1 Tax=Apodospora peruviana TaxID=516989 RepID=A0AAE0M4P7_9PEZI|nr:hypothetical protein B0H66DRAFT_558904 [Apodospora peruviana]